MTKLRRRRILRLGGRNNERSWKMVCGDVQELQTNIDMVEWNLMSSRSRALIWSWGTQGNVSQYVSQSAIGSCVAINKCTATKYLCMSEEKRRSWKKIKGIICKVSY